MRHQSWRGLHRAGAGLFAILIGALAAAGCSTASIPFHTVCYQDELEALRGKRIAILRFDYDPDLLVAEAIPLNVGEAIAEEQKADFVEHFEPLFEVVDLTAGEDALTGSEVPDADDAEAIRAILEEAGADGAILVTNGYGYELQKGILEAVADQVTEDAVGEQGANFLQLFGENPTIVSWYYFASDTTIVNREGEVVWQFAGKAAMMPRPFSGTLGEEAETFWRGVMALNPTERELARELRPLHTQYTDYVEWLVEADMEGADDLSYYSGYPEERADRRHIAVYPASDRTHVPAVRTDEEIARAAEAEQNSLWTAARAGRWGRFGEWPQAGAAGKLFGVFLVAAFIGSFIYDKAGEKSLLGQAFGLIGAVSAIAMLVALYHVLKAVF